MVYTYTPAYYSTLHDSITSLCKNILPFSLKKRRLPSAEQKLAEMQSDNLKWQQNSFHQMLNLIGLNKEGILGEAEVAAFRAHLLDTLIAAPPPALMEHPPILRDKLLFLQELLYAKCITIEEYHASKRPLLQRLAVQGAEIDARDVIIGGAAKDIKPNNNNINKPNLDEEWSEIDLKDENCLLNKESSHSKNKSKHGSSVKKQIKGAASALGFASSFKPNKNRHEKSIFDTFSENLTSQNPNMKENPVRESVLMAAASPPPPQRPPPEALKRKPFKTIFKSDGEKKQWGFVDGLKKLAKNEYNDETAPLPHNEGYSSIGEGPDMKQIKRKLHSDGSPSDFFIDKVLGDNIKKELSRIQTELSTSNPNLKFSSEQMEAVSTKLPVDKTDLKKFFPKSWCDQYGDLVLDVVKKEFKDHVGEMEKMKNAARERHHNNTANTTQWTTFDDENNNPNWSSQHDEVNPFFVQKQSSKWY